MNRTFCKVGKTQPLIDFVNNYLLQTFIQDSGKYLPNYLSFAQRVYKDLDFDILTSEKRVIMPINKKLNTITLPLELLYWQQISVIDDDDKIIPLQENDMTLLPYTEEVVPSVCPNPKCESDLCASVKSISAVTEDVYFDFPDPDTKYTNVTRTQVWPDGSVIKEVCAYYPIIVDGNISAVEERCSTEQLCKLDMVDECVAETTTNTETVKRCCSPYSGCTPKKILPTINVLDGVVYFSNGNYDRVLLTYKTSGINFGMEVMVPSIAEEAMIAGIAFKALEHKRNVGDGEKERARAYWNIHKNKLRIRLNPIREQEFKDASRIYRIVF